MPNQPDLKPVRLGLEGKVGVVTGAGGGIGSAIFHRLLVEGAFPIGIDLTKPYPIVKTSKRQF